MSMSSWQNHSSFEAIFHHQTFQDEVEAPEATKIFLWLEGSCLVCFTYYQSSWGIWSFCSWRSGNCKLPLWTWVAEVYRGQRPWSVSGKISSTNHSAKWQGRFRLQRKMECWAKRFYELALSDRLLEPYLQPKVEQRREMKRVKIYDYLSRDLREFIPPRGKSACVCGPTVYNYIHVRNARSTVAFDNDSSLCFRVSWATEVAHISNIDVDDKIINRAKRRRHLLLRKWQTSILRPFVRMWRLLAWKLGKTRHPRVVEFMDDIIRFVADLIEKAMPMRAKGCLFPWKNPTTMQI